MVQIAWLFQTVPPTIQIVDGSSLHFFYPYTTLDSRRHLSLLTAEDRLVAAAAAADNTWRRRDIHKMQRSVDLLQFGRSVVCVFQKKMVASARGVKQIVQRDAAAAAGPATLLDTAGGEEQMLAVEILGFARV